MDGFAMPLAVFTAFMVWLLVEVIRGSIDDSVPRRAGVTWAVTCPVAGLLFGIGLAPFAIVFGVVSTLALGSLAYWFLAAEESGEDDPPVEPVAPDPIPGDDTGPDPDYLFEYAFEWTQNGWERQALTLAGDSHHFELPA